MQRAYTFPRSISFCFTCAHAATYEVNIQRAFCPIIISLLTGKFQKRLPRLALCRFVTLPLTCKTPTQATCQLASYTCTSFSRIMCLDEPIHPCFRRYSSVYSRLVVDQPAVITQRLISSVYFSVSSFLIFVYVFLVPMQHPIFPDVRLHVPTSNMFQDMLYDAICLRIFLLHVSHSSLHVQHVIWIPSSSNHPKTIGQPQANLKNP